MRGTLKVSNDMMRRLVVEWVRKEAPYVTKVTSVRKDKGNEWLIDVEMSQPPAPEPKLPESMPEDPKP